MDVVNLIVAALISFWSLLALHYFPWDRLLGRPLRPPCTYVVGTLAWGSVYAGWLALRAAWLELVAMCVIVAAAGLAVAGAYALDWILDLVHENRALNGDVEDRDGLLEERDATAAH